MGVLDKVNQMKAKGMEEDEIISTLQQQGVSPKNINEVLNQSQIKNAVSGGTDEELEPSIRGEVPPSPPEQRPNYSPGIQEVGEETYQSPPEKIEESPPAPEETYSPPEQYPEYGGYGGYMQDTGGGTDTFIEIAEQVFLEKTKEIQKQMDDLNEFKSLTHIKLDHVAERVKKIESVMDKLQMAILDKVGSYGKTLESIKKEMSMMQDSFGKVIKRTAEKTHTTHKTITHKKKTGKKK